VWDFRRGEGFIEDRNTSLFFEVPEFVASLGFARANEILIILSLDRFLSIRRSLAFLDATGRGKPSVAKW